MNFEEIKELIWIVNESNISKVEIKNGEFEITLEKGRDEVVVESKPPKAVEAEEISQPETPANTDSTTSSDDRVIVTLNSPMVGTFYAAPAPNAPRFVNVGDKVSKGQTIAILEAMKIMNEWEAEFDCKILKVLVEDGQPVEYGTPIFEVEKL